MSNYRKTMADALREMYPLTEETQLDEGVFDPKDGEKWAKEIQKGIKAPVVDVKTSSLGGEESMSIMVKFSMEKEASKGGTAFFNSRYANVRVDIDGSMEMFQASHKFGIKKMRKAKIKSTKDVIKKINDWIVKVPSLKEEVDLDEFTKKDFDSNEDQNMHTENAVELARKFGTSKEYDQMVAIYKTHMKKGEISRSDQMKRDALVKKYLPKLKEEVDLDEAILKDRDYEVDEKEGVVKISKKNFAKVSKDAKGTDKSKPTMMVLTKKGTSLYPVKFTEEVDLDEDFSVEVPKQKIAGKTYGGGATVIVKAKTASQAIKMVAKRLDVDVNLLKTGKVVKEEVGLDENLNQMKKHIDDLEFERKRMTTSGQLYLDKLIKAKSIKDARKAFEDMYEDGNFKRITSSGQESMVKIGKMLGMKIVEEVDLDERFRYKIYTGKTYLGKEYGKDEDEAKKNALSGGGAASNWKTKLSSNDLKAIKEEVDLDEGTKQVLAHGGKGQYKAVRDGSITKVMYKGKVVGTADFDRGADSFFASIKGEKGQKSFDDAQAMVDYFAKNKITEEVDLDEADDFKPHMMYDPKTGKGYKADTMDDHLRMKKMGYTHDAPKKEEAELDEGKMQDMWQKKNAQSLSVGPFELLRGKSGVHTIKRSGKVLGDFSYDSDADNFVANMKGMRGQWTGNDIDSLFTHLQKVHKEEFELDEGKMSQLHQYIKDKKSPEEIAKMMKLDVKTVKALMAGYMSSSYHESYEIGTDEYREHTQEITPGQEITDFQRFKVESMKEALAKVWGLDEAKKEEKKENKDLTKASKSGKVITGSDADEIDLKPKTAE